MPEFSKLHVVNHNARDMFELVADVEQYPQFVPMCESLVVRSRRVKGDKERIVADMCVAYKFIRESFSSHVTLDRKLLHVDVHYIDGPFAYLDNNWKFTDMAPGKSEISFAIDYEFKNRALGLLMGSMFELVFSRFTAAFEKRADEIYGVKRIS